nr:Atu4866 domain-containing protein [Paenibacillus amylolyticus]
MAGFFYRTTTDPLHNGEKQRNLLKPRGVRNNGAQFNGRPTRTKTPVCGKHIEYVDDTGFTADGDFRDGVLYHAGMVLYRENVQ